VVNQSLPRLMLVTDRRRTRGRELVDVVAAAVSGGVGMVQIRENDLAPRDLEGLVGRIRRRVPPSTVLCVNSAAEVAGECGVGLHLPEKLAMPDVAEVDLVGRSVHGAAEAERAARQGIGYLILGPIYPTAAKPGHPGAGVGLVEKIARRVDPVPLFAIGGMEVSRVPEIIHAGAHGIAVAGAILSASDPQRAAEAFALALVVACPARAATPPGLGS
jgi:thiamine-phosphate pyrophosphorylase